MTKRKPTEPADYYDEVAKKYSDETEKLMGLLSLDFYSPLRRIAAQHFSDLFRDALHARILVPERIRALYPILRDLVDEVKEIEDENRTFEARSRARDERKLKAAQRIVSSREQNHSGH